ncbi:hypothetical protein AB0L98_38215 [Streptomyces xanthochromogenes]
MGILWCVFDELAVTGLRPAALVADTGYGASADFDCGDDGTIPLVWLIVQWPEGESEPEKCWISNLPAAMPAKDLVRLAQARWRIENDRRGLNISLGLDHFGHLFTGWHRYVTLVTADHLFLTEQRTSPEAPVGGSPSEVASNSPALGLRRRDEGGESVRQKVRRRTKSRSMVRDSASRALGELHGRHARALGNFG